MPTAKFVSAIFVNILAGLSLATAAHGEPAAADGCLSAPWGDAPAGSHWRYHIDHVNKRNCWYLRNASGELSQASPQKSAPPAQNSAPPEPPLPHAKPSVAEARAELSPQTVRADKPVASPATSAAGNPADTAANQASSVNSSIWNATAAVATRWPDLPIASTPKVAPATTMAANDVRQPSADPAMAILPSIPFTHLTLPMQPQTIAGLIAATIVALAFVMLLIKRQRTRRVRRRFVRSGRGPLLETTDDDRIVLSDHPNPDGRSYRFAHGVPNVPHRARELGRRPPPRRASK